jgi:hypothetical protein
VLTAAILVAAGGFLLLRGGAKPSTAHLINSVTLTLRMPPARGQGRLVTMVEGPEAWDRHGVPTTVLDVRVRTLSLEGGRRIASPCR